MRVFLLDLWLDLREKRLAPVAILLLAGIIAVPLVLANSEEAPPAPATPTTTTAAAAAPVVESQPEETVVNSKLQTFSPRDPFEPTSTAGTTPSAGTTTTTTTTGGSTGGTTTTETTTGTSGGGTTGTGPSTGNGTGNGTGNTTTGETKTTLFTYTVDLRFGKSDSIKSYKNVQRLELIPNEKDPKIVFLGVTTTGKTAVFLVSQDIGIETSGRCRPSTDECTFLYLRPDREHDLATLTDSDGTVYHMRLSDIDRVTVSSSDGGANNNGNDNGNGNPESNRSPAFTGRAKSDDESDAAPADDAPPGEPDKRSSFNQFFADGSDAGSAGE